MERGVIEIRWWTITCERKEKKWTQTHIYIHVFITYTLIDKAHLSGGRGRKFFHVVFSIESAEMRPHYIYCSWDGSTLIPNVTIIFEQKALHLRKNIMCRTSKRERKSGREKERLRENWQKERQREWERIEWRWWICVRVNVFELKFWMKKLINHHLIEIYILTMLFNTMKP